MKPTNNTNNIMFSSTSINKSWWWWWWHRSIQSIRGGVGWRSMRVLLVILMFLFFICLQKAQLLSLTMSLEHILENYNQQQQQVTSTDNMINASNTSNIDDTYGYNPLQNQILSVAKSVTEPEVSYENNHLVTHKDNVQQQNDSSIERILRLWKTYQQEHSESNLIKEWNAYQQQYQYQSTNWNITTTLGGSNASFTSRKQSQPPPVQRRYAMALYSCPLQAGNRLHHFFNAVIWSVITNRTVLWKYYDQPTCQSLGWSHAQGICKAANTEPDCAKVLDRASWIPSYDQWSTALWTMIKSSSSNMTNTTKLGVVEEVSYWSTYEKLPHHKRWYDGAEKLAGLADTMTAPIVVYGQMLGQDAAILKNPRKRNRLLTTPAARDRAEILLSLGADFLYGLIFQETFSILPSPSSSSKLMRTIDVPNNHRHDTTSNKDVASSSRTTDRVERSHGVAYSKGIDSNTVAVALHSRHIKETDDGSNIQREVKCIQTVLSQIQQTWHHDNHHNKTISTPSAFNCQIVLMSDRNATLTLLMEYLAQDQLQWQHQQQQQSLNASRTNISTGNKTTTLSANRTTSPYPFLPFPCRGIVAAHPTVGQSFLAEHGPFAGAGYFQDLALATSQARHGFIGANRSSSMLVRELIEYHRHMEAFRDWQGHKKNQPQEQLPSLAKCYFGRK